MLSQEIGWEERLRNDLFCVEWDVKPYSVQITFVKLKSAADGRDSCGTSFSFLSNDVCGIQTNIVLGLFLFLFCCLF